MVLVALLALAGAASAAAWWALAPTTPEPVYVEPRPAPQPPEVRLSRATVPQGAAAVLTVSSPDVARVVVRLQGQAVPLTRTGDTWWALLPAGLPAGEDAFLPPGGYRLVVNYRYREPYAWRFALATVTVAPTEFPLSQVSLPGDASEVLDPALEAQEAKTLADVYGQWTPEKRWEGAFLVPTAGPVTTEFVARRSYNGGAITGTHGGIDIAAGYGAPVLASAGGVVAWVGDLPVHGRFVAIDHGGGVFTTYAHLSAVHVRAGDRVAAGERVADVGSTGRSTGPHLHWELVVRGSYVDPLPWVEADPLVGAMASAAQVP